MKTARPFKVSTFGLSPDMKRVHPAFGRVNRGEVSRHTLFEALEVYRRVGSQSDEPGSHVAIQSDKGRFIVRVSGGQLTLGLADMPAAKAVPLAAEEIVTRVEQAPTATGIAEPPPPPPPPEPPWRIGTAVVLVLAGVGLTVFALKPVIVPEAERSDDITLVADAIALKAQRQALPGLFVTGEQNGDRRLTISPNGYVEFAELGPRQAIASGTDTFQVGQRGRKVCLVTSRNGVIEVLDRNTLVFYGDTYRRLE